MNITNATITTAIITLTTFPTSPPKPPPLWPLLLPSSSSSSPLSIPPSHHQSLLGDLAFHFLEKCFFPSFPKILSQIQWVGLFGSEPDADTSSSFSLHLEHNTIQTTFKDLRSPVPLAADDFSYNILRSPFTRTSRPCWLLVLLTCISTTGPSCFMVSAVAVPAFTAVSATDCSSAITALLLRPRPGGTSASHWNHLCSQM